MGRERWNRGGEKLREGEGGVEGRRGGGEGEGEQMKRGPKRRGVEGKIVRGIGLGGWEGEEDRSDVFFVDGIMSRSQEKGFIFLHEVEENRGDIFLVGRIMSK